MELIEQLAPTKRTMQLLKNKAKRFVKTPRAETRKTVNKARKKVKKARTELKPRAMKFASSVFRKLPIERNTVFLESHRGLSYSGNPKAITEEILAQNFGAKVVWSFADPETEAPAGVQKVKKRSVPYYYYHACAKVLVHNGEFGQALPIREDQVYINTQHGTPLKLMGTDLPHKKVVAAEYTRNGRWSWLVSPNRYSSEIFSRAYMYDGPTLEVGYPRNDILVRSSAEDVRRLRQKLGLPLDKKVLMYAPTWRDVKARGVDKKFALKLDLDALYERFSETHVVILRLHHLIATRLKISKELQSFAFDRSEGKYDAQELMAAADILITDYSSMMFDFANTKRPTIFYTYDLEKYTNGRGMYFNIEEEAPGPVVCTMPEVLDAIADVERWTPEYEARAQAFRKKFCAEDQGTASKTVVDRLIRPALGRTP